MPRRITWTADETESVAEQAFRARLADPVPGLLALINHAQRAVLPQGRRRRIRDLKTARTLVDGIAARFARHLSGLASDEQEDAMVAYVVNLLLASHPGAAVHVRDPTDFSARSVSR